VIVAENARVCVLSDSSGPRSRPATRAGRRWPQGCHEAAALAVQRGTGREATDQVLENLSWCA